MKNILGALVLVIALPAFAEDEVVAEETTETETVTTQVEPPQENWAECDQSYLNYIRDNKLSKKSEEFDKWWMLNDRDYRSTKNDEFKYREEKPKKEKEFNQLLAEKPALQSVIVNVKFEKYDFKNKRFPINIKLGKDKTFENHFDGRMYSSGIGGGPSPYVMGCTMKVDSKFDKVIPSMIKFKPTNLAQVKFIQVGEEQAKVITAGLGQTRVVGVTMRMLPAQTSLKNGFANYKELIVTSSIKELEFHTGQENLTVKF